MTVHGDIIITNVVVVVVAAPHEIGWCGMGWYEMVCEQCARERDRQERETRDKGQFSLSRALSLLLHYAPCVSKRAYAVTVSVRVVCCVVM